ncbi:hypothetical protein C8R47DRAFT_682482 [Mycena vitilis]|nr:hypothetical protein C8R47DRAFT_682482 [Mycena vitilis]
MARPPISSSLFPSCMTWEIFKASADYLVRVCSAASNVKRLTIAMRGISTGFSDLPCCTLVHLTSLWTSDCSVFRSTDSVPGGLIKPWCRVATLLAKFTCPALREFETGSIHEVLESDIPSVKKDLVSFLARSPLITRMALRIELDYGDILLDILRQVSALEEIKISHLCVYSADFLEHLTYIPVAAALPLCPRLRVFDGVQYRQVESALALVNMIASRWRVPDDGPVARLESITVNCEDSDAQCAEQLAELVKEGPKLQLKAERFELRQPKKPKDIEKEIGNVEDEIVDSEGGGEGETTGCASQ